MNNSLPFRQLLVISLLAIALISCTSEDQITTTTEGDRPTATTSIAPATTTTATPATTLPEDLPEPAMVTVDADQEGFAAPVWDDNEYGEPEFASALGALAETGAEWVTLVPTWYQSAPESSVVYPERPGRTSTDEDLLVAVDLARSLGLKIILKPHVDVVGGESRLRIAPSDVEEWFDSYGSMLLAYAELAESHGIEQFVIGTELAGVSGELEEWRSLVATVRSVYTGGITYAANHDEYLSVEFWEDLDFIGVDAYFPLATEPETDVGRLVRAWEPIIDEIAQLAEAQGRPVVFTEIGYPSQEGAVTAPYNPSISDIVSDEEQAAALDAMLEVTDDQPWFAGFHWWMWNRERSQAEKALGYTPEGKPAGETLHARWSGS